MISLPAQQLDTRVATAEVAFQGLGSVHVADPGAISTTRTIVLRVEHPGWSLPTSAVLEFKERWMFSAGMWDLAEYAYECRPQPGPARAAFHWHQSVFHLHCVDPYAAERDHHFQGTPIELFDAYMDFGQLLAAGGRVSCEGLTPLH